jgi:NAD(P)-dependent dehydrogenase (short-subunit alcohol dehydrogenase family)
MSELNGKVVLVTGAASGIGAACVSRFLHDGARVFRTDVVTPDRARDQEAGTDGAAFVQLDVRDEAAIRDVVAAVVEQYGRLDAVVTAAGVAGGGPAHLVDREEWQRVLDVNLTGVFLCIQEGGRAIANAGKGGAIVVTTSTNSFWVEQNMAPYNTSKAGEVALIRTAALDLAGYGIRVNGVAPGVVRTRISEWVIDDPVLGPEYLKKIPIGRFGEPGDVADAVAFLASADAGYITGQTLILDGGLTLGQPLEAMDIALPGADS